MARHMTDDSHTYRAVVTTKTVYEDGRPDRNYTEIFGPYQTKGAAKGQITRESDRVIRYNRYHRGYTEVVSGHVEKSSTKWEKVED